MAPALFARFWGVSWQSFSAFFAPGRGEWIKSLKTSSYWNLSLCFLLKFKRIKARVLTNPSRNLCPEVDVSSSSWALDWIGWEFNTKYTLTTSLGLSYFKQSLIALFLPSINSYTKLNELLPSQLLNKFRQVSLCCFDQIGQHFWPPLGVSAP